LLAISITMATIEKSGWLKLKGNEIVWKWRFCVAFQDGTFSWFMDDQATEAEGGIALPTAHVQYFRDFDALCFGVTLPNGVPAQFAAKDPREAESWVGALLRVQSGVALPFIPHHSFMDFRGPYGMGPHYPGHGYSAHGLSYAMPGNRKIQMPERQPEPEPEKPAEQPEPPAWMRELLYEQEVLCSTEDFLVQKAKRIAAAKRGLLDVPQLPKYGQVLEQEGAHRKSDFVYTSSCAPVKAAAQWSAPIPGPEGISPGQMIAADFRADAPVSAYGYGALELAKREHKRLQAENLHLRQSLASINQD